MWSECSPVEMCFNELEPCSIVTVGEPITTTSQKTLMPCKFSKRLEQNSVIVQTSFSHYINIRLVKRIFDNQQTHTEQHTQRYNCVKLLDSNFKNHPRNAEDFTIEFWFMCTNYGLRYTIFELIRTLYLRGVPVKFQNFWKHIFLVISGTSSLNLACNPRHPSRNFSCNHRDGQYFLHRKTSKLGSTAT